jgi:sec-independent protein translocase protein TatC
MVMPDDGLGSAAAERALGLSHRANPQARMPLMEHIRELRNRVVKVIAAVAVGAIVGWFFYPHIWHFIQGPFCKVPQPHTLAVYGGKTSCPLYFNGLFDAFFLKLQICIVGGIILSAPIWLFQLWAFIAPGLYQRERRWAYYFVGAAVPLFAIGAVIAYFAMTKGIHFLLGEAPAGAIPLITINTYLSYAGAMLALFGITFELPLVFVLLNLAGVLTHARFKKWRRMIIFLIFAFAAVFTPSPDPLSMLLLALPCVVLVEVSEIFVWVHDRRKARTGSLAYPGLSGEEVAEFGLDKPLGDVDVDAAAGSSAGS